MELNKILSAIHIIMLTKSKMKIISNAVGLVDRGSPQNKKKVWVKKFIRAADNDLICPEMQRLYIFFLVF